MYVSFMLLLAAGKVRKIKMNPFLIFMVVQCNSQEVYECFYVCTKIRLILRKAKN